jgi:hypothetical protein
MSCTHACALSWHLQLMSLASPAESGMTIILERLCISPTEAIRQGDRPYMQHSIENIYRMIGDDALLD